MSQTGQHEVLIVGAGPAGSIAGMALARRGHKVLMIDKAIFPRDKICGDGVLNHTLAMLCDLGMKERLPAPGFYPTRGHRTVSSCGIEMKCDTGRVAGYVVPRLQFDALLQSHAVECGADFLHAKAVAPLLEDGRVAGVRAIHDGKEVDLRARVTIVADGANSVIAQQLAPANRKNTRMLLAVRAYVEGFETSPHTLEFHSLPFHAMGYIWIFPLGDGRANIGLGMRTRELNKPGKSLKKLLEEFLARPDMLARRQPGFKMHAPGAWPLPVASSRRIQRTFNGAILIGDAGAFIDSVSAGGLLTGAVSARLAADAVHDALSSGDMSLECLREFDRKCAPLVRKMQMDALTIWISYKLPFFWDLVSLAGGQSRWVQARFIDCLVERSAFYNRLCPVSEPYEHEEKQERNS